MLTWIVLGIVLLPFLLVGVVAYAMVRVGALSDQREFLEEEEETGAEGDKTDAGTTLL